MPKPDNKFINEFRKKFGDLLLTGNGRGRGDAGVDARHPEIPINHVMEIDPLDSTQPDMSEMTLGLPINSLISHTFDDLGSCVPQLSAKTEQYLLIAVSQGQARPFTTKQVTSVLL